MTHDSTAPRFKTQDPKYDIQDGKLINATTGVPIPEDEPVFLIRGKDRLALPTLYDYLNRAQNFEHSKAVLNRAADFANFAKKHPERMQEPDTVIDTSTS